MDAASNRHIERVYVVRRGSNRCQTGNRPPGGPPSPRRVLPPTTRSRPAVTCARVHGGVGRRNLAVISQLTIRNSKEMVAKAPASAATIGSTSITDRAVARSKRRSGRLVQIGGGLPVNE